MKAKTLPIDASIIAEALNNPNLDVFGLGWMGLPFPTPIDAVRIENGKVWVKEAAGMQGWFIPTGIETANKD